MLRLRTYQLGTLRQRGGGLYNFNGSATLTDVILSGNQASGEGGGVYNLGTLILISDTLSGNSTAVYGGGISNETGALTMTDITLSANSSLYYGGIFNNLGLSTLTNVTLSGDSATLAGGGIFNNSGTPRLTNVTLSGNSAEVGGSISSAAPISLTNTIVANSPSSGNCSAALGGAENLSSDNTCGFGAGRDNVDVLLSPLGNYGGPTLTQLPIPGSPAIDYGIDIGCPSTDQRGLPRPAGLRCDVGAVERQAVDAGSVYEPLILR